MIGEIENVRVVVWDFNTSPSVMDRKTYSKTSHGSKEN
jgi:hypothetical protein